MLLNLIIFFIICLISYAVHKYLSSGFVLSILVSALIVTLPATIYLTLGNIDFVKLETPFGIISNKSSAIIFLSSLAFIASALISSGIGWYLRFQEKNK